jgi:MFS family permease
MTQAERQGWVVVGSLFTTLFLVFGAGYNTAGVFVTPLVEHFGWLRTQVSLLQTALALSAGAVVPLVGVLLDRLEARGVIAVGAGLAGGGFLLASRADGFAPLLLAYVLVGAGLGAATLLPCSLVIANWFGVRRGLALGVAMGGTSLGGMVMTLVASRVMTWAGWRAAYLALGLPMLAIVVPVVLATVRTRPAATAGIAETGDALPGLEVGAALRVRSFWLVALAQLFFAFAAAGTNLHAIPYLIGLGYAPTRAAQVVGLVLGFAGLGKLAMGFVADRIGGRRALVANFILCACGMTSLLFAGSPLAAAVFVLTYGLAVGAPLTLIPMVMAESLGLRRFGSLSGLAGLFNVAGAATGPVVAGRFFDASGSYTTPFAVFIGALVLGAAVSAGCVPLDASARLRPARAARA